MVVLDLDIETRDVVEQILGDQLAFQPTLGGRHMLVEQPGRVALADSLRDPLSGIRSASGLALGRVCCVQRGSRIR
ncbi:MAG: hypothetical protein ACRDYA_20765 [Egibacteraceae bacterium]